MLISNNEWQIYILYTFNDWCASNVIFITRGFKKFRELQCLHKWKCFKHWLTCKLETRNITNQRVEIYYIIIM